MSDSAGEEKHDKILFWGCFISLIATAFIFTARVTTIDAWGTDLGLTETQRGQVLGAGLWPFAITIVLFSLIIDKIGYGRAMAFAFVSHMISAGMLAFGQNYEMLYWGSLIGALGNGTVEAVINPVVATMFKKEKTKWLNILHAGWPGGMVVAGLVMFVIFPEQSWRFKLGLVFVPTIIYGVMLVTRKFPVHERVLAGVSYKDMLAQLGGVGALIIAGLMTFEIGRVLGENGVVHLPNYVLFGITIVFAVGYGIYVKSLGQPLFVLLCLIMVPLATTELGVDSWITGLMEPAMADMGIEESGWVLIYTSFIMMLLRFSAGPIVSRISPLGLLAASCVIAIIGLYTLSLSVGIVILVAATFYGFGKAFFWPTMLGIVAERFPKGGALTLNTIAGVGMLGVGIIGNPVLGNMQDSKVEQQMVEYDESNGTSLQADYMGEAEWLFGSYEAVNVDALSEAPEEVQGTVNGFIAAAKKNTLAQVIVFPGIMLVCYIGLILYFRSQGGYSVVHLDEPEQEEAHAAPEEF